MSLEFRIKKQARITHNPKGFTLIELLVVIAIIAVLVGILLPQFSNYNRYQALQSSASQLQSNLRLAQNNALSGVECLPGTKAADWHLKFTDDSHYKVEADCTLLPTPTPGSQINSTLPSAVKLDRIILSGSGQSDCPTDANTDVIKDFAVLFSNVNGLVNFQSSSSSGCPISGTTEKMEFVLRLTDDTSKILKVIVERGGSIYLNSN